MPDPIANAKCPLCGGDIIEHKFSKEGKERHFFSCSNHKEKNCSFIIWATIGGTKITEAIVRELCAPGRTAKPLKMKSKAGKPFEAFLVYDHEQKKVIYDFPPRK